MKDLLESFITSVLPIVIAFVIAFTLKTCAKVHPAHISLPHNTEITQSK